MMELHLVGGFLGSGKTTAIASAARMLVSQGIKVAIITNEQGRHLVDTGFIRSENLPALDVTEGCICCHLDDFADRIEEISQKFNPEILFAESVGSCADLVATVINPLLEIRKTSAVPASLSVFADSRLFLRWLKGQEMPFSEQVMYIYDKQLEEAGLIVINKVDLFTEEEKEEVFTLANKRFPQKQIRLQNSLEENQVRDWLEQIRSQAGLLTGESLEIDYDLYADGESRFTWLEKEIRLFAGRQLLIDQICDFVEKLPGKLPDEELRIAHIKFLLDSNHNSKKISVTGEELLAGQLLEELEAEFTFFDGQVHFFINIMVEGASLELESTVNEMLKVYFGIPGIKFEELSSFIRVPGYPKPTMRVPEKKNN